MFRPRACDGYCRSDFRPPPCRSSSASGGSGTTSPGVFTTLLSGFAAPPSREFASVQRDRSRVVASILTSRLARRAEPLRPSIVPSPDLRSSSWRSPTSSRLRPRWPITRADRGETSCHCRQSRCHAGATQSALEGTGRADRHQRAERLAAQVGQGQRRPLRHARTDLRCARLSARRHPGISA